MPEGTQNCEGTHDGIAGFGARQKKNCRELLLLTSRQSPQQDSLPLYLIQEKDKFMFFWIKKLEQLPLSIPTKSRSTYSPIIPFKTLYHKV
ncbi:hypothetical protein PR048_020063 [Dryococelus australis]|uniref:Uncharacterized protein n=1 Tax=Dryococelus australis TaxID=614101 RepID=A0ABQ9H595_9NEOP|nr:hypothetical protein PR048_020063 [Dryococelus australis]